MRGYGVRVEGLPTLDPGGEEEDVVVGPLPEVEEGQRLALGRLKEDIVAALCQARQYAVPASFRRGFPRSVPARSPKKVEYLTWSAASSSTTRSLLPAELTAWTTAASSSTKTEKRDFIAAEERQLKRAKSIDLVEKRSRQLDVAAHGTVGAGVGKEGQVLEVRCCFPPVARLAIALDT